MKNSSIYPCHLPDLIFQGGQGQAPMSLTVKTFRQPDETELRTPCPPSLKKFAHEGDLYLYPSGYPASPLPPTKFTQVLLPPLPASCGTITLPCNPPPSGKKNKNQVAKVTLRKVPLTSVLPATPLLQCFARLLLCSTTGLFKKIQSILQSFSYQLVTQ